LNATQSQASNLQTGDLLAAKQHSRAEFLRHVPIGRMVGRAGLCAPQPAAWLEGGAQRSARPTRSTSICDVEKAPGLHLTAASRRHCRSALALAAAWMLTQALALDVEVVPFEVVPVGKWPAYSRGPAVGLAVQSDRAYVAAGEGGLIIIDIRDPANPQRVGGYDTKGEAGGRGGRRQLRLRGGWGRWFAGD